MAFGAHVGANLCELLVGCKAIRILRSSKQKNITTLLKYSLCQRGVIGYTIVTKKIQVRANTNTDKNIKNH